MKRILLIIVVVCFTLTGLMAQTGKGVVKGKLTDTIYKEVLSEATITVLNPKDSSIVSFVLANTKGEFVISDLDSGTYRLTASYSGYATFSRYFKISQDSSIIDLGTVQMLKRRSVGEVIVEAPPISVKKDRLSSGRRIQTNLTQLLRIS